jgi:hypothetical protein
MKTLNQRAYNCKDEELPVICNYAVFSLKRDLADFTGFSPKFNEEYVTAFETKIASVSEVIMPRSETLDLKNITARLYATMDGLIDPINRVSGYLKLAEPGIKISAADFGLTQLRKSINTKNAEGVISNIRTVSTNLTKNVTLLAAQGLSPELAGRFTEAATSIAADNQKQYEITSNRRNIVQNNLGLFNSLNEQLTEILRVGKILYKATDAVKAQEYTFAAMKKKVSNPAKQAEVTTPVTATA